MADILEFTSHVGDQPWFFVADTGTEGGTATVDGVPCVETQITLSERTWPDGTVAHGVGFKVPAPFTAPGDVRFQVKQDKTKTEYLIHVIEREG
jgi:predicted P-loop ATPase